jgi:hypothetical protein
MMHSKKFRGALNTSTGMVLELRCSGFHNIDVVTIRECVKLSGVGAVRG